MPQSISLLYLPRNQEVSAARCPYKATQEDKEEKEEAYKSTAAAKETGVGAVVTTVLKKWMAFSH